MPRVYNGLGIVFERGEVGKTLNSLTSTRELFGKGLALFAAFVF